MEEGRGRPYLRSIPTGIAPGPNGLPPGGSMSTMRPGAHPRRAAALLGGLALLIPVLVACTSGATAAPSPSPSPTALTVGLGYIPNVQFAQFYLAQEAGYYADAGLAVTFENKIDPDLIRLTGQGAVDISIADGTSLIPAVSQGIPVRYVATIYARFPNVVFAASDSGITAADDLAGRRLGIPGRYGSSWIMLQALLASADLSVDDLTIVEYPDFGQLAGVQQGAIDAATGFANNEPVRLGLADAEPVVLTIDDVVPLPGNGLIVGEAALAAKRDAIAAFIAATLRAMSEIIADPQVGLDAAIAAVPELVGGEQPPLDVQRAVLDATVLMWQNELTATAGLGAIDPADWTSSIEYLETLPGDLVPNPVTAEQLVTTELLPGS
jgi:NitT/TauT family transport system substrate-binding protein